MFRQVFLLTSSRLEMTKIKRLAPVILPIRRNFAENRGLPYGERAKQDDTRQQQTPCQDGAVHENERQRLTRSISKAEIPSVTIVCYAPLAQLDRASASDAEGQRFESSRARH